ncbi:MAG: tyrosine--tRNA ligase [Patescibacteria group bacterium]|nr:tyrosine--tRNA ligase [Patescibacteria group bacterium]
MEDPEVKINEILTRGIGELVDPEGVFKEKLAKKTRGEYKGEIIVKFGVDPTRPDIHLGHAVVLRKLRQLQDLGCKAVFLVGDFTAQIGDPTGKNKIRPEIEQKEVEHNLKTYLDQVGKILLTNKEAFSWIRNSDWFMGITDLFVPQPVTYTDNTTGQNVVFPPNSFQAKAAVYDKTRMQTSVLNKTEIHNITLRTFLSILRNVTHSQLVQRDMFAERIKKGEELYMHEMLYPILQGVDSHVLYKVYGSCDVEIGGTDQTFNMLMGRTVMKAGKQEPQAVMSMKILEGLDGKEKMSKSLDNYIAITDTPEDMYGKVMSLPDTSIVRYYELCTYTPQGEVEEIGNILAEGKINPRDIKMKLAHQIVSIYHGEKEAEKAEESFVHTFQKKEIPTDMPETRADKGEVLADVLLKAGLVSSKSDFRRLAAEGAIKDIETNEKITDAHVTVQKTIILKIGKKKFAKVVTK